MLERNRIGERLASYNRVVALRAQRPHTHAIARGAARPGRVALEHRQHALRQRRVGNRRDREQHQRAARLEAAKRYGMLADLESRWLQEMHHISHVTPYDALRHERAYRIETIRAQPRGEPAKAQVHVAQELIFPSLPCVATNVLVEVTTAGALLTW